EILKRQQNLFQRRKKKVITSGRPYIPNANNYRWRDDGAQRSGKLHPNDTHFVILPRNEICHLRNLRSNRPNTYVVITPNIPDTTINAYIFGILAPNSALRMASPRPPDGM